MGKSPNERKNVPSYGTCPIDVSNVKNVKKPFKCHLCDKNSVTDCDLKEHIAIAHEGEKPHNCDLCDEIFASDCDLKEHNDAAHEGKKPFKCNLCDNYFTLNYDLHEHPGTGTRRLPKVTFWAIAEAVAEGSDFLQNNY